MQMWLWLIETVILNVVPSGGGARVSLRTATCLFLHKGSAECENICLVLLIISFLLCSFFCLSFSFFCPFFHIVIHEENLCHRERHRSVASNSVLISWTLFHSDITIMVDLPLKINYLSISDVMNGLHIKFCVVIIFTGFSCHHFQ